ncbi:MAG: hypothetical protein WCE47_16405 [Gaiella sp.]|uniref:hypothetical protein n=1 Tax=Gaiella sp. TaxID=2663207 RepID=UPI003C73EFB9
MREPKARSLTPFLVRRLPPCADVDRLRALLDEGGEAGGLEAWPVIRDERDRADLAGLGVGEQLSERTAAKPLGLCDRLFGRLDRVALVLLGGDVPAELEL